MKKTKKFLAGAVTLMAAATLAACSSSADKDIITMKGSTISVSEFYDQVKYNSQAQQVLLSMIIGDVFEKEHHRPQVEGVQHRYLQPKNRTALLYQRGSS